MVHKPHWLSQDQWSELLQRCNGIPRCVVTGETEDLTIDHIIPRRHGGTDDVSNLQFMSRVENARKGTKTDSYWEQMFYFDQVPMLASCRAGQSGLYNTIMAYNDWFSRAPGEISRLLYTWAMVVGAGKTLAVPIAACAYNNVVRARWGATRRADRILVLTKERAIRDQFAADVARESVKYGIFKTEPRVDVITRGSQFDLARLQSHDIIVACIHQLWEDARSDLPQLLHYFPLIFIDEPHFAVDQVYSIVETATSSICFGGTGSPIDGLGRLLERMIRLYVFTWQDADEHDHSVKYLDQLDWQHNHVIMAKVSDAELLRFGQVTSLESDELPPGYEKNFEPAKSVVFDTIRHMEGCDGLMPLFSTKAPHRRNYDCEITELYPVHALICCDSVRFAEHLCRVTNLMLDNDRSRWPRTAGWHAMVVHAEGEESDGRQREDKPLLPEHPWLRASKQSRKLDVKCARILFVVGMGREGVNNPLCGVVGMTSDSASQVEVVQRIIGRQIRSIISQANGHLGVAPAELDSVTIITHEVFKPVLAAIGKGIEFVTDMETKLQGLFSIEDLDNGVEVGQRELPPEDLAIPFKDKLEICGMIGENPKPDAAYDEEIIRKMSRGNPGMERPIADFIERVRTQPADVAKALKIPRGKRLLEYATVLWEAIQQNPSDKQLAAFLRIHYPDLLNLFNEQNRRLVEALYNKHASEVAAATPPLLNADGSERHIDQIRKNISGTIIRDLDSHYYKNKTPEMDRALHKLVGSAVKTVLGVPADKSASNGSQWDIPNCLIMLERAEIYRDIKCYVISRLIEEGYCPQLAYLHR
jgi:hypothetical protein